jgi:hypothetical protein
MEMAGVGAVKGLGWLKGRWGREDAVVASWKGNVTEGAGKPCTEKVHRLPSLITVQ